VGGDALPEIDVSAVLDGIEIVLQPVVDVATGVVVVMEALARFGHAPGQPADKVIARAHQAGFGYTLEAACLRAALARREHLPAGVRLAVNLSPDVVHHPVVARSWPDDLDGVIVEITEYRANSPTALRDQLAHLRMRGAAIAVDDVSTGYAGLLRLASMRPDFVKIDRSVVSGVRDSMAQSAVLEALVTFSHRLRAAVIGEGVETLEDLVALAEFDVDCGQGWAIGRPAAYPEPVSALVVATCQQTRRHLLQRHAAAGVSATTTYGMHAVTSALSHATGLAELHSAVARAATELGVDVVGVSVLGADNRLREIASSGDPIDTTSYPLDEYPATQKVLRTGETVEVHVSDPAADPAERIVLERLGHASLLIIPFFLDEQPIGILELARAVGGGGRDIRCAPMGRSWRVNR
jgi:EAL domain-containing protein (putative c-di-GMP-specific phosphodiesterase class I)